MDSILFHPIDPATQPPLDAPGYRSTQWRHPNHAPIALPGGYTPTETAAPYFDQGRYPALTDLARNGTHEAMGERIIVGGQVLDEDGRPQPGVMLEIWQANAAGRYNHPADQHDAPLDPHFRGTGTVFTDANGRYRYVTVKPGAYPWPNHHNAWRPNHIHVSLFGAGYAQRLITQMYFPGDPLLALDPILGSIPDPAARARLVSSFDLDLTEPNRALGYRFDITLRGRRATHFEDHA